MGQRLPGPPGQGGKESPEPWTRAGAALFWFDLQASLAECQLPVGLTTQATPFSLAYPVLTYATGGFFLTISLFTLLSAPEHTLPLGVGSKPNKTKQVMHGFSH